MTLLKNLAGAVGGSSAAPAWPAATHRRTGLARDGAALVVGGGVAFEVFENFGVALCNARLKVIVDFFFDPSY
jgi:hypothetical protein